MHIKAKDEGREGLYIVEKEEIKKYITEKGFEKIHNQTPSGSMILGADWDIESVKNEIDNSDGIVLVTKDSPYINGQMGHALSIVTGMKLRLFDIGEISKNELDIC